MCAEHTTNELPGEIVTDVQKIDPDWWLVKNEAGQVRCLRAGPVDNY